LYNNEYGSPEVKSQLRGIRGRIYATPGWLEQIQQKAKDKNISTEEMLELDAKFVYDMEVKGKK